MYGQCLLRPSRTTSRAPERRSHHARCGCLAKLAVPALLASDGKRVMEHRLPGSLEFRYGVGEAPKITSATVET